MKEKIKKIILDYKEAREEYSNQKKRCGNLRIKKEQIDKISRLQYLFLLTKSHWILILILILIIIRTITKAFEINIGSYIIFAGIGLIFQVFSAIFFGRGLIKNKYEIALESTTRWDYNPDLIKSNIKNTFDATIGWMFLMIGFMLQLVALMLSFLV